MRRGEVIKSKAGTERVKHVIAKAQVRRRANGIPAVSATLADSERAPPSNRLQRFAMDREAEHRLSIELPVWTSVSADHDADGKRTGELEPPLDARRHTFNFLQDCLRSSGSTPPVSTGGQQPSRRSLFNVKINEVNRLIRLSVATPLPPPPLPPGRHAVMHV